MSFKTYYYDSQFRSYILQFMDLFVGLRIRTGYRDDGSPIDIRVPVVYDSTDRVAAYLMAGGSECLENQLVSLPIMGIEMTQLALRPESNRHPGIRDRRTYMTVDDSIEANTPEEAAAKIRVKSRSMPVAYTMTLELTIVTTNTDHQLQLLEQILMVFNPALDIQTTDKPWDWTALTKVTLKDISLDVDYPEIENERIVGATLTYEMPVWVSGPMKDTVNEYVAAVRTQIRDATLVDEPLDTLIIQEPQAVAQGTTKDGISIELVAGTGVPDDSRVDVSEDENGVDSGHVIPPTDIDAP